MSTAKVRTIERITQRDLMLVQGLDATHKKFRTMLRKLFKAGATIEPGEWTINREAAMQPERPLVIPSRIQPGRETARKGHRRNAAR